MATAVGLPVVEAVTVVPEPVVHVSRRAATVRLALGAAFLVSQWTFVAGAAWDIQWHVAVGRDRLFAAPHLLLLAGIAVTGLLALCGVLGWTVTTWRERRPAVRGAPVGRTGAIGGAIGAARAAGRAGRAGSNRLSSMEGVEGVRLASFVGIFRAPLGVYVAGFGAFCSAIAFPLDDYWHRLHGMDVTIWAPFHVMILGGMALAALGTAYTFAPEANLARPPPAPGEPAVLRRLLDRLTGQTGWARLGASVGASAGVALGLATVAATLLIFLVQALDRDGILAVRPQPAIIFPTLLVLLTIPWLVAAAPALRLPGGATLAALVLMVLRAGLFAFVPWAVRAMVVAEGLAVRPSAPPFTVTALAFPAWVLLAGLVIDGLWWLAHTRRLALPTLPTLLLAGTVAGVLLAVLDRPWATTLPLSRAGQGIDVQAALVTSLPAVAVGGLVAATLGAGLGAALRRTRV